MSHVHGPTEHHPTVLSELELRFSGNDQQILCDLGNIRQSETPVKESFSQVAKFCTIDGEILEAEQKMYASFRRVCGLGYMTVSEMFDCFRNVADNARE